MKKIAFVVLITTLLLALIGCTIVSGQSDSLEESVFETVETFESESDCLQSEEPVSESEEESEESEEPVSESEEESEESVLQSFTVSFVFEDGSTYHVEEVLEGECVQIPTTPEKAGFDFIGWFVGEEEFDFNTVISESMEIVGLFEEVAIWLTCTEDSIYTNEEYTAYFYAQCNVTVETVYLYEREEGLLYEMYDDGLYSVSGDDLQGDGVYSCMITRSFSEPAEYVLYAMADGEIQSNEVTIIVEDPLSEQEIDTIQNTSESLTQTIEQAISDEMTTEEKAEVVIEVLEDIANQSQEASVQSESIFFDDASGVVSFEYENGTKGIICLNSGFNNGEPVITAGGQRSVDGKSGMPIIIPSTTSAGNPIKTVGDAIVLFSFDDPTNSEWISTYQNIASEWTNAGLFTEIKTQPTAEDYKTALLNKKLIVVAEHGVYYEDFWGNQESVIKLTEEVTVAKTLSYSSDLVNHRIILAVDVETNEWVYCLTAKFFEYYYSGTSLNDSIVYLDNCYGFGTGAEVDNRLAQTLVSCGAEAVVGYHEEVYIAYGIYIMYDMIGEMLLGETIGDAFASAKEKWGNNDVEFAQAYTQWDTSNHPAATPNLHGEAETTLIRSDFINGSFEDGLSGWSTIGDVRVINKLAEFNPIHGSKMAILTTGIGSTESIYIQGTEGSILIQSFKVLEGASSLSLSYNVISEEPMEYVGSQYDDKVVIEILDEEGNVVAQLAYESVNTSEWHRVYNINFEGGDDTTYCTYWNTVTFAQLSDYEGQTLTLRIRVWDVGDSIYDTAVIVDNIVIA